MIDWKNRIKKMRSLAGMTQQEFAVSMGFAMSTVSKWETGDMIPNWMSQERLIAFEETLDKKDREREVINH